MCAYEFVLKHCRKDLVVIISAQLYHIYQNLQDTNILRSVRKDKFKAIAHYGYALSARGSQFLDPSLS